MSTYLITGCSQGLGLALAQLLAQQPASQTSTVFATTRRTEPPAALQEVIAASSGRVIHIQLDITSDSSVTSAVDQAKTHLGDKGLDVLVNNAGHTATCQSAFVGDMDDLFSCFNTNVVAVHRTIKAFLSLLRASTEKKIMNISSTQGSCGRAFQPPHSYAHAPDYKISKAALNMLTRQWAKSLKDEGFCVEAISPGHLQTVLGTFSGKVSADLPAEVGAESVLRIIQGSEEPDNGRFRDIEVKGWHHRYAGVDPSW